MVAIKIVNCVVCNVTMRQMDSVRTNWHVCSTACDEIRVKALPKRITATCVKFWTNKGYSEKDAELQVQKTQKERSPRCIEHWLKKGLSKADAEIKVSEWQTKISKIGIDGSTHEERQQRNSFSPEYWILKGFARDEASAIVKFNSSTVSLPTLIRKHGEVIGTEMYNAHCAKMKEVNSIDGYIERHGEELGRQMWFSKFKNRHCSNKACDFFSQLIENINYCGKIYTALNKLGEYGVQNVDTKTYYFYDFVIPELNICIEFNGDYWHANPAKYDAQFYNSQCEMYAHELWENDRIKLECIQKLRGFETYVVWESTAAQQLSEVIALINDKIQEKSL
jgi:hypothetical protein